MKNIVIISKTLNRYDHIRKGLSDLSERSFKITNSFFPVKTLLKFKRHHFLQILFPTPDLLIIDQNISVITEEGHATLLKKIYDFRFLSEKTKIIVLINSELENNSKDFNTFVFSENAKAKDIIHELYANVIEILEESKIPL